MDARPIVVEYHSSPDAGAALRWALDEGDRAAVPVKLVYSYAWHIGSALFAPGPSASPDADARAGATAMLADAVDDARKSHPRVAVSAVVVDGPAQVCLRDASADAAMVVLGGRGRGRLAELLVGSTAVSESASAGARLVVVGSRGRGGLTGTFLGSVGQELIHHARCPIAIVHDTDVALTSPRNPLALSHRQPGRRLAGSG